jgi:hypothetical protein
MVYSKEDKILDVSFERSVEMFDVSYDSDKDSIPDYKDNDADGNGIPDLDETEEEQTEISLTRTVIEGDYISHRLTYSENHNYIVTVNVLEGDNIDVVIVNDADERSIYRSPEQQIDMLFFKSGFDLKSHDTVIKPEDFNYNTPSDELLVVIDNVDIKFFVGESIGASPTGDVTYQITIEREPIDKENENENLVNDYNNTKMDGNSILQKYSWIIFLLVILVLIALVSYAWYNKRE